MQQKNKKASILLWVFFLTILLAISFIYISVWIRKSLTTDSWKIKTLEENRKKENFLANINKKSIKIWENNLIIKNFSSIIYTLKKDELLNLKFEEEWNINLQLLNSWIISYSIWSNELWKNILPTYNTWITTANFNINAWENLKIKNFSWNSKIKISANNTIIYKLSLLPKIIKFKKSWEINLSVWREWWKIKYKINNWTEYFLKWNSSVTYVNKKIFINSWDELKIEKVSWDNYKKVIISWNQNLSDMLDNNTYKIIKESWWRKFIIEKWKIK
jgi:hypothetical protein